MAISAQAGSLPRARGSAQGARLTRQFGTPFAFSITARRSDADGMNATCREPGTAEAGLEQRVGLSLRLELLVKVDKILSWPRMGPVPP